jgi:hypothetical protein
VCACFAFAPALDDGLGFGLVDGLGLGLALDDAGALEACDLNTGPDAECGAAVPQAAIVSAAAKSPVAHAAVAVRRVSIAGNRTSSRATRAGLVSRSSGR